MSTIFYWFAIGVAFLVLSLRLMKREKQKSAATRLEKMKSERPVFYYLTVEHVCPDCKNDKFLMGPQGGACQNIKCVKCSAEFNVGPIDDGEFIDEPMIAERISS